MMCARSIELKMAERQSIGLLYQAIYYHNNCGQKNSLYVSTYLENKTDSGDTTEKTIQWPAGNERYGIQFKEEEMR